MKTQTITVHTRLQDNGDGGYTFYAYNSEEELLADHPKSEEGELTKEEKEEILFEEDPHENGYIGTDTIQLEIADDGSVKLADKLWFHAGQ